MAAAVRETEEETGLHVRLTRPLADQHYQAAGGPKTVRYWTGRVVGRDDVDDYAANHEIDDVRWVGAEEAADALTYDRDRATLAEALKVRARTTAVVVLRHAEARSRKAWRGDDRERPLIQRGHTTAHRLVPLLAAYDVTRVVTSSSTRCVQTVAPFAETAGWRSRRAAGCRRRTPPRNRSPAWSPACSRRAAARWCAATGQYCPSSSTRSGWPTRGWRPVRSPSSTSARDAWVCWSVICHASQAPPGQVHVIVVSGYRLRRTSLVWCSRLVYPRRLIRSLPLTSLGVDKQVTRRRWRPR